MVLRKIWKSLLELKSFKKINRVFTVVKGFYLLDLSIKLFCFLELLDF